MFTLAKFTNGRGSSSAWVRRFLLPRERRTCFHCSAASGLMSPTVCCCRCWERPLPESLFSSTHPSKTTKNHINKLRLPVGLHRYWAESWLLARIWSNCDANHIQWALFIHLFFWSKTLKVQLSCSAANGGRLALNFNCEDETWGSLKTQCVLRQVLLNKLDLAEEERYKTWMTCVQKQLPASFL